MTKKFMVRLTLRFVDGTTSMTIVDIVEAIELDRAVRESKNAPLKGNSVVSVSYETEEADD